jgi:hypothetical protein
MSGKTWSLLSAWLLFSIRFGVRKMMLHCITRTNSIEPNLSVSLIALTNMLHRFSPNIWHLTFCAIHSCRFTGVLMGLMGPPQSFFLELPDLFALAASAGVLARRGPQRGPGGGYQPLKGFKISETLNCWSSIRIRESAESGVPDLLGLLDTGTLIIITTG